MSSKDPTRDGRESFSTNRAESLKTSSETEGEAELLEERIRLSTKGALRESGRPTQFEVRLDPNSTSGELEKEKMMLEQLESVDFFIDQGFLDVALNALERLDKAYPNHPL